MELEIRGGVAVLSMRAGKANAIGAAFLERLSAQLDALEASDAAALVLTGEGKSFSAGLDLPEVMALDRPALGIRDRDERSQRSVVAAPGRLVQCGLAGQ